MSQDNQIIYFRIDCGGIIGSGHLSRCLSIAAEFKKRGYQVSFIIRQRPSLKNLSLPYPVIWLSEIEDVPTQEVASWINQSESMEVRDLLELNLPNGIIFVDHYGLNEEWCKTIKQRGYYLVKLRDFGEDVFGCDLIVDYRNSVTESKANVLSGFKYIPLNSEIKKHKKKESFSCDIRTIGVYIGGVGIEGYKKLLKVMGDRAEIKKATIDWIVPNEKYQQELLKEKTGLNVRFSLPRPDLFDFYLQNDLFIGASGVSFFERAYLGVLQLNFIVADNQKSFASVLKNMGVMCLVGEINKSSEEELTHKMASFFSDFNKVVLAAQKGKELIGADGSAQICQDIISTRRNTCTL